MVNPHDVVLLGLLSDGPLHGYEIKQQSERKLRDIAKISPGTIYYTLKKLEKNGWVSSKSERAGKRPERRVFEITESGTAHFRELLDEVLELDERPFYLFDLALFFHRHLEPGRLQRAIDRKLSTIQAFRQRLASMERGDSGPWPFPYEAYRERARLLLNAFDTWYRNLGYTLPRPASRGASEGEVSTAGAQRTLRQAGSRYIRWSRQVVGTFAGPGRSHGSLEGYAPIVLSRAGCPLSR